jgi:peptide deformylase
MKNYNTGREPLLLREYGRNVQNMIKQIAQMEDRDARTQATKLLVDILKQLNPAVREHSDNLHRIWDHLHLMSGYSLDIEGPFPVPHPTQSVLRPAPLTYKAKDLKFKHYGRNLEFLVDYALTIEDENDRLQAIAYVGRLIKNFYTQWSKEALDDTVIIEHLKKLSNGKISLSPEFVKEVALFEGNLNGENRQQNYPQHNNNYQGGRKKPHFYGNKSNNRHKR